jgi:polyisoprenoid-binding protein YceI
MPIISVFAALLLASAWEPEPLPDSLRFEGTQQGARFAGRFARFEADIRFDPEDPVQGRFAVEVDLASADTRSPERDEVLLGPAFFDVTRHPKARFEAAEMRHHGEDRWLAAATLTLRGRTVAFPFPFRFVEESEGQARILAEVELDRFAFGLGEDPDWRDEALIGRMVRVFVDLPLRQQPLPEEDATRNPPP